MRYRYLHCDVFTDAIFGGNPLAVLPDARGPKIAGTSVLVAEGSMEVP